MKGSTRRRETDWERSDWDQLIFCPTHPRLIEWLHDDVIGMIAWLDDWMVGMMKWWNAWVIACGVIEWLKWLEWLNDWNVDNECVMMYLAPSRVPGWIAGHMTLFVDQRRIGARRWDSTSSIDVHGLMWMIATSGEQQTMHTRYRSHYVEFGWYDDHSTGLLVNSVWFDIVWFDVEDDRFDHLIPNTQHCWKHPVLCLASPRLAAKHYIVHDSICIWRPG